MSETLEELKAIVDNAPEIATLVDVAEDGEIDYMYVVKENESGEKILSCCNNDDAAIEYGDGNIRSLSDIKRIIDLTELNENMHTTVSGYEIGHPYYECNYDLGA